MIIALKDHMDFGLKEFKFFLSEVKPPCPKVALNTGNPPLTRGPD